MARWEIPELDLDPLLADCMQARSNIRVWVTEKRLEAARWTPRPCPPRPKR